MGVRTLNQTSIPMSIRPVALMLLLASPLPLVRTVWAPAPTPGQETGSDEAQEDATDKDDITPAWLQNRKQQREMLEKGLEGGWNLIQYIDDQAPAGSSVQLDGFAVFSRGFFAISLQGLELDPLNYQDFPLFQSGIHNYRIGPFGKLQTSTIISSSNMSGFVDFEIEGSVREYDVEFFADEMTIRTSEGTRFVWAKVEESDGEQFPLAAIELLKNREK